MKKKRPGKRATHAELRALEKELDRVYAWMRERARYEWSLHQGQKKDPADASVSVRVTAGNQPAPPAPGKSKPRPRLLAPKPKAGKTRRTISPARRHR